MVGGASLAHGLHDGLRGRDVAESDEGGDEGVERGGAGGDAGGEHAVEDARHQVPAAGARAHLDEDVVGDRIRLGLEEVHFVEQVPERLAVPGVGAGAQRGVEGSRVGKGRPGDYYCRAIIVESLEEGLEEADGLAWWGEARHHGGVGAAVGEHEALPQHVQDEGACEIGIPGPGGSGGGERQGVGIQQREGVAGAEALEESGGAGEGIRGIGGTERELCEEA